MHNTPGPVLQKINPLIDISTHAAAEQIPKIRSSLERISSLHPFLAAFSIPTFPSPF